MKPSGKSQTNRNTFKNIILGSNLEITYFFNGSLELHFSRKSGGKRASDFIY